MIRNNKWKLLMSSIAILLPMIMGGVFWSELPARMAIHWGFDGNANGWSNKGFVVFGLPLILLLLQWICVFATEKDPRNESQNKKVYGMVLWICPIITLFASVITYANAFGKELHIRRVTVFLMGGVFVVIGNYMPKCKQNYTIGIKVKWTLDNEENWNATHRWGGKVWVAGGLLLVTCAFLPESLMSLVLVVIPPVMVIAPIAYSYLYYKKH